MTWRLHLAWALVLAACAAWEYHGVLAAGTVYEDTRWTMLTPTWSGVFGRPLTVWTWTMTRTWPLPAQHLVSLGLHVLAAGLAGLLAWRLSMTPGAAWTVTALVLLWPMQGEAVAYLAARDELLATCGLLGAAHGALSGGWGWLGVAACLGVAVASKETAVIGVALVSLVRGSWRGWALGLAVSVAVALWWGVHRAQGSLAFLGWQMIAAGRVLTTAMWWRFSADYDYGQIGPLATGLYLAAVPLLGVVTWLTARLAPLVALGCGWAFAVLVLRSSLITQGVLMPEHHLYLGTIGLALAVAASTDHLAAWWTCQR